MTTGEADIQAEKPGTTGKGSGRNPSWYPVGASNVTARREAPNLKNSQLMEVVVERGNMNYFQLAEVKGVFERLDGWIRRKLRCILWRQWKRPATRARNLMKRGLKEERAWRSATNQRGPWWNSSASHMNAALPKRFFDRLGLVSLLNQLQRLQCST
ncbi:MAG: hypothetical protein HQL68_10250 [Magnetococcales bacterium]|nr:hypothetical protein [Magnetococcales bacterium]